MWEFAEACFFATIIWTVGTIYKELKELSEKVDRLIEATTKGTGSR